MSTRLGKILENKKVNLMGRLLSKIQHERWTARQKIVSDLWKRNNLDNPTRRQGYKMEEVKSVRGEGEEVITFRLWHLVDQSTVTISSSITSKVTNGVPKGEADVDNGEVKDNSTDSPI